jgi:ubiquinone/menaquinone biosynthesis C-methylase UbiE
LKNIKKIQNQEINFWKNSKDEKPSVWSIRKVLEKTSHGIDFLDSLSQIAILNSKKSFKVLEIGGGQGWASCLLKSTYPKAHVTATDISSYAVASVHKWEEMFKVKVDNSYNCKSNETQEKDCSIDFIFTFAAAHHFITHRETINEISRILKKGGVAAYFCEPVTQLFWYPIAYKRVNRKRPEVHEDLLIISKLRSLAIKAGLEFSLIRTPSYNNRSGYIETFYYLILSAFPFLQKFVPHTATILFVKK